MLQMRLNQGSVRLLSSNLPRRSWGRLSSRYTPRPTLTVACSTVAGSKASGSDAAAAELKLPLDLLQSFPDLVRVAEFRRTGKLKQAVDTVSSALQIMVNATGPASVHSKSLLRLHTALQFDSFADHALPESVADVKKLFPDVDEFQVDGLMLLSSHRFIRSDVAGAILAAEAAVNACEDSSVTPAVPVHCFSPAYGLKGLAHLLRGDAEEADTYLQMSARWSQSPQHTLVALNNLGALHWLLHTGPPLSSPAPSNDNKGVSGIAGGGGDVSFDAQRVQQDFVELPISKHNNRYSASSSTSSGAPDQSSSNSRGLAPSDIERIRIAIEYWTEAVNTRSVNTPDKSASMCGAPSSSFSSSSSSSGGITQSGNLLSPDDSVQYHSFSSTSTTTSSSSSSSSNSDAVASEDSHSATAIPIALSGLLCNLAEAHNATGDLDRATEYLSNALKALQDVQHGAPYVCAPALGRVLGLLAYQSMYSSQAVTAEGLFRASLEHLRKNSLAVSRDCRVRYELAVVGGRQGLLLSKWDKRENEGRALILNSQTAIANEYANITNISTGGGSISNSDSDSGNKPVLLTMTLQLPHIL